MAFNEKLVATVVSNINRIPWLGPKIEAPFKEFLAKQKEKLHRKAGSPVESVSIFSFFEGIFTKKCNVYVTQFGYVMIFLSLRFYVKSILGILEVQNLPF